MQNKKVQDKVLEKYQSRSGYEKFFPNNLQSEIIFLFKKIWHKWKGGLVREATQKSRVTANELETTKCEKVQWG